jgi:hypothetical protein
MRAGADRAYYYKELTIPSRKYPGFGGGLELSYRTKYLADSFPCMDSGIGQTMNFWALIEKQYLFDTSMTSTSNLIC